MGNYTTLHVRNEIYETVIQDLGLIKKSPVSLSPDDNFIMFSYFPDIAKYTKANIIGNACWTRERQMRFAESHGINVVEWFTAADFEVDPEIAFEAGYVAKRDFTYSGDGVEYYTEIEEAVNHVISGGIVTKAIENSKLYKIEFIGDDFLFCWQRPEKSLLAGYHSQLSDRSIWVPEEAFLNKIKGFIAELNTDKNIFFCTLDFLEEDGVLKLIEINTIGSAQRTGLYLDENYRDNFIAALKNRINFVLAGENEPEEGVSE